MNIELTEEQKIKILNSDDIYTIMQQVLLREEKVDQEKEHFWMIGLANNNRLQYIELVSMGSVNAANVEPMNVFRIAVMKGSVRAVLVHNHPSGDPRPSEEDEGITDRLIQVGRILNIPVFEHLIITPKSYYSFVENGLLAKLQKSKIWVPAYELVDEMKKEEERLRAEAVKLASQKSLEKGLKQGKREGKLEGLAEGKKEGMVEGRRAGMLEGKFEGMLEKEKEIVREMKKEGEPVEKIMRYTSLSQEEIEKL